VTPAPRTPGGASDAAVEAAKFALDAYVKRMPVVNAIWTPQVAAALAAAHAPELGDQRSVCLADVLAFLDANRGGAHGGCYTSADDVRNAIADEFGDSDE